MSRTIRSDQATNASRQATSSRSAILAAIATRETAWYLQRDPEVLQLLTR